MQQHAQLRLPLEDSRSVMLVHETDLNSPEAFEIFVEYYQPKWLLDIRIAPRMDFIAPTRALALRMLSALDVNYVDVFGRISDASRWLEFVENLVQSHDRAKGLYAIVFDDQCNLQDAKLQLPPLFRRLLKTESISVSTFQRELLAM
ncbi:hypothetical protein JE034_00450 [Achromobacter xylosoxidans]|uniref:hypothetical protein n=1 Tax=Alcaligenes xylosoxydans xylosoxydans TaxID=85698 RepID=UPI001908AE33|nr:hypothetical protein [Achromobacter xylosoxidans]MBK1977312.1 hypothetical protein [Achromobacter xylosoxidans]